MADVVNPSQIWSATITIGNITCPCYQWSTDIGTYGQIGRGTIKTSITALNNAGINLDTLNASTFTVGAGSSIGGSLSVASSNNIPITIAVNNVTIFGGYYFFGVYEHHMDEAEISFRDYACVFFDSKTSLATLKLANKSVSDLVTEICQSKGLTPQINIPEAIADESVGSIFTGLGVSSSAPSGQVANFSSYPRSLWSVLVFLARAVGANIYTVPTANVQGTTSTLTDLNPGTLFFEQFPTNPVINRFYWMPQMPLVGPFPRPIRRLTTLHQPQRNKNFAVVVKSFHGPSVEISTAAATVTNAGVFSASGSGAQVRSLLSNAGNGIPVYEFRIDGLLSGDVQAKAEEIANAIAAKLFVQTCVVDFDSSLRPLQQAVIIPANGAIGLLGFQSPTMYINGVTHSMNINQGGGVGEGGLITVLKLLNLPPASNPLTADSLGAIIGGAGEDPNQAGGL